MATNAKPKHAMIEPTLLDHLPLWGFVLALLGITVAATECGYRFGRYRGQKSDEKEEAVGAIVGATVGLLAFMLAFTFGLAASRWDTRREVFLDETNAIGTTYLRADLLPGDHGANVRNLLREYVDVRLEVQKPNADVRDLIRRSESLHTRLWAETVKASRHKDKDSEMISSFVGTLNQVIDLHTKRVTVGIRGRIPATIWGTLIFLAIVAVAGTGYQAGLSGSRRSVLGLGLVLGFVVVLWLIADLDRPMEGVLRVNQQAMIDLRESMKSETP